MNKYRYLSPRITPLEQENNLTVRAYYQAALKRDEKRRKRIHEQTVKYLIRMGRFKRKEKSSLAPRENDNLIIRRAKETILEVQKLLDGGETIERTTVGTNTLPNPRRRKQASASICRISRKPRTQSVELNAPDDVDFKPVTTLLTSLNAALVCTEKVNVKTDLESEDSPSGTPVSPKLLQGSVAEDQSKSNEAEAFETDLKCQIKFTSRPCSSPPVQSRTSSPRFPVTSGLNTTQNTVYESLTGNSKQSNMSAPSISLESPVKQRKHNRNSSKKKTVFKSRKKKNNPLLSAHTSMVKQQNEHELVQNSQLLLPVQRQNSSDEIHFGHHSDTNSSIQSDGTCNKVVEPLVLGRDPKSKIWQALCTQRSCPPRLMLKARKKAAIVSSCHRQGPV